MIPGANPISPTHSIQKTWHYRDRRLRQIEWGLWRSDRKDEYFLCYRPHGARGPLVRRWATIGPRLSLADLKEHVRQIRSGTIRRRVGLRLVMTCEEAQAEFLNDLRRRQRSAIHIRNCNTTISRFLEQTSVRNVSDITTVDLARFLGRLHRAGRSPRTQNKARALLGGWLNWACRRQYIERNPITGVEPASEVRRLPQFPMPAEMKTLVEKAPSRYDGSLWVLFLLTGLRKGSVLELQAEDFQETGIFVRHTKRGREWMIRYDDGCPLWLPQISELGRRTWARRIPTSSYIRGRWNRTREQAGLPYPLKSLRHAFCSWLAMMGESLQDVAAWAHHASVTTTERWYAHLRPRGRQRAKANRQQVREMCSQLLTLTLLGRA